MDTLRLFEELARLPNGPRATVIALLDWQIGEYRNEMEEADSDTHLRKLQGAISALRYVRKKLEKTTPEGGF